MKIAESQLRQIIREEITRARPPRRIDEATIAPGPITSSDDFDALQPGDRITVNGAPCVVVEYDQFDATLSYTREGKSTLMTLDARYAWTEEPGEVPEINVVWVSTGAPVARPRRAPRPRRTPYSYYD